MIKYGIQVKKILKKYLNKKNNINTRDIKMTPMSPNSLMDDPSV